MTPKFKHDPEHNCLREVARVKKPHHHPWADNTGNPISADKNADDWHRYNAHLSSLRVIPCAPGSKWPEGEMLEGVDFYLSLFAIPLTPQHRLYTQEEAEEIYNAGFVQGTRDQSTQRDKIAKQQYFKTRFNVDEL